MKTQRILSLVVVLSLVVLSSMVVGCGEDEAGDTGTVRVTLQDAPVDAEKVEVAISEVAVHYVPSDRGSEEEEEDDAEANGNEDPHKAGWRTVMAEEQVFELLSLKDNPTQLGEFAFGAGKITQIRMYLSEEAPHVITVAGQEHDLEVSSHSVKIVGNFDIHADETTEIHLDFDVESSLKENNDGSYSLRPTVKLVD